MPDRLRNNRQMNDHKAPAELEIPSSTWTAAATLSPRDGGKRVLVLGCAPLPFENQRMNYAPGTRTWQFARPLATAGHAVCVVGSRIPGAYGEDLTAVVELTRAGVVIYTLPRAAFEAPRVLPGLIEAFAPDVVVGASALPSRRAAELAGERPVWIDLFGDPMAEAQAKAVVDGAATAPLRDDSVTFAPLRGDSVTSAPLRGDSVTSAPLRGDSVTSAPLRGDGVTFAPLRDDLAYFHLMWTLLERGDAFAAVSGRQHHAVIGQLGFFGRLNRATQGLELVHTVPCALWQGPGSVAGRSAEPPADVAADDFVVLWSGGFNTWCDVDTLFQALEQAMAVNPAIRFVSTGGEIAGHDEDSYRRFIALVEASELRSRFVLKGRLPAAEADRYLARADLGVVTERPVYERFLGSSARMVNWLGRGLPFVCAEVSELGTTLAAGGFALTYAPGDAGALARRIVAAAADPDRLRRLGERGRKFARRQYSFERTTRPLREWVERAERLPDAGVPQLRPFVEVHCRNLEARIRDLEQRLDRREEDYHRVRRELGEIHQSKAWRWWMKYLEWRRVLLRPFGSNARRNAGARDSV